MFWLYLRALVVSLHDAGTCTLFFGPFYESLLLLHLVAVMGYFDGFRKDGRNSYYAGRHVPVFYDVTHLYLISFCLVIVVTYVIIVLGTRGREVSPSESEPNSV